MQFEIILKNDKVKYYKLIALILVLLNAAFFIFLLIADVHFYRAALALSFSGLYLCYFLYAAKKNGKVFFITPAAFVILAGSWMALQNYLLAFVCITVGILYHLSLQDVAFIFNGDFIRKMNFPRKTYPWEMLTNVKLKDNILTIDCKNNTLIQHETESNINERQFNEFANQRLFKNHDLQ